MKKLKLLAFLLFCYLGLRAQDATPPFWSDIVAFKRADAGNPPVKQPILFVGSSSFTKWKDVNDYFPGYPIINRGFGGSTLVDVIRYAYDVILPYQPKQVVIYCGDNDIANNASAGEVTLRFKTLFGIIRTNLPTAAIDFVSIKASPSRKQFFGEVKAANASIKAFLATQKNAGFINIYSAMLDGQGNPREELFLSDMLHMKPAGYAIWQKVMQPYLLK